MSILGAIKWFAIGYYVKGLLTKPQPIDSDELPTWWPDVMLRAFAPDQIAPRPTTMPPAVADAAGAAASAVQVPIGWLYELLQAGLDPGKLQLAASALAHAAKTLGPPKDAQPATLAAWKSQVAKNAGVI